MTSPSPRRTASTLLGLRVLLWRSRHLVRLAALVAVALVVVRAYAPEPPTTTPVVVTARPVAAGTELTRADLRVVRLADDVVDGAAAEVGEVLARTSLVDLPAGLPVVDQVLEGARFGIEPPDGTVVVPVALTDGGLAALLRPGDHIDVVTTSTDAAGEEQTELLAQRALVIDLREPPDRGLGAGFAPAAEQAAPTVTVAVSPAEGRRLAGSGGWSVLGGVLVP